MLCVEYRGLHAVAAFLKGAQDELEVALGRPDGEPLDVLRDEHLGPEPFEQPRVLEKEIVHALRLVAVGVGLAPPLFALAADGERAAWRRTVEQVYLPGPLADDFKDALRRDLPDVPRVQIDAGMVEPIGLLRFRDELRGIQDAIPRHPVAEAASPAAGKGRDDGKPVGGHLLNLPHEGDAVRGFATTHSRTSGTGGWS